MRPVLGFLAWVVVGTAWAWRSCPQDEGGGVCPDRNTCCATGVLGISSCITEESSAHDGSSVCCVDDGEGVTGCGPGYHCASDFYKGSLRRFCQLTGIESVKRARKPGRLPRYNLCHVPEVHLQQVYSLPVKSAPIGAPQLAYYSTMGSLDDTDFTSSHRNVRFILIVVHGSGRNADDYLCCAQSAVPESLQEAESVLILAPRFLAIEDGPVNVTNSSVDLLRWNETDPIPHTWRYGADAINAPISSYEAMDVLVDRLTREHFPFLERIIVAGHSAGGQFTHRWALTSNSPSWGADLDADKSSSPSLHVPIHVVVANPRSFSYLDGRRYVNGTFQLPSAEAVDACPTYNSWEWGLDPGGDLLTPYKDRALVKAGGPRPMADRYMLRNVVYIAGSLDILTVRSSCEDDTFQGKNRRERSLWFFDSLNEQYEHHNHLRYVAANVPHDHCLIFQSREFHEASWGLTVAST